MSRVIIIFNALLLGSWTLDNYKQKLQSMEEAKVDRVKMIEEYLQNQQHEIDKGLFVYVKMFFKLIIYVNFAFLRSFPDLNNYVDRTIQIDNNSI